MKSLVTTFFAIALTLLLSFNGLAWDPQGHMMVAAAAYDKLTPAKKARVDLLISKNPDKSPSKQNWFKRIPAGTSPEEQKKMLFMLASTWPDLIKGDRRYQSDGPDDGNRPPTDGSANNNKGYKDLAMHKYWHFIDNPFRSDGSTNDLPEIPFPNVKTRITDFRAVLASPSKPVKLKSYDLCWLLHLVGDIHQPLHCTTRVGLGTSDDDHGGNLVVLSAAPRKLHSFWDELTDEHHKDDSPVSAETLALGLPLPPTVMAGDLDVDHWITESVEAAKNKVYLNPPVGDGLGPFTLDPAYETQCLTIATARIALAGARLAKILNDELN